MHFHLSAMHIIAGMSQSRALPHTSIVRPELGGALEVMHCIDRHVQQFIRLAEAIPSPIVFGVERCGPPVRIYTSRGQQFI